MPQVIESFDLELKGQSREMMLNLMRDPVGFDSEVEDDGSTLRVRVNPDCLEGLCEDLRDYDGPHAAKAKQLFDQVSMEMVAEENPPEGGIPANAPPDQTLGPDADMAFSMETCDHEELPPDVVNAAQNINLEALETGTVPASANDAIEDAAWEEIIARDQGPLPPPWARYPETFNIDLNPVFLPEEAKSIFEISAEYEEPMLIAANPADAGCFAALMEKVAPENRAEALGMKPASLLGSNPKLSKGGKLNLLSVGLPLAPWGVSGFTNLCPYASKGCANGCLNLSGVAENLYKDVIASARERRTIFLMKNRDEFPIIYARAMRSWQKLADKRPSDWSDTIKKNLKWSPSDSDDLHRLILRMNVLSDLPWEQLYLRVPTNLSGRPEVSCDKTETVMELYPKIQYYDYTKNPDRMLRFVAAHYHKENVEWPKKYFLTFSWSEINAPFAFHVLDQGGNVAIPFDTKKGKPLPKTFCGYPVIDADLHDARFLDDEENSALREKSGLICGLRLKGQKQIREYAVDNEKELEHGLLPGELTGGFVQRAGVETDEKYKQMLITEADRKAEEQANDPQGWKGHGFRGLSLRAKKAIE